MENEDILQLLYTNNATQCSAALAWAALTHCSNLLIKDKLFHKIQLQLRLKFLCPLLVWLNNDTNLHSSFGMLFRLQNKNCKCEHCNILVVNHMDWKQWKPFQERTITSYDPRRNECAFMNLLINNLLWISFGIYCS